MAQKERNAVGELSRSRVARISVKDSEQLFFGKKASIFIVYTFVLITFIYFTVLYPYLMSMSLKLDYLF